MQLPDDQGVPIAGRVPIEDVVHVADEMMSDASLYFVAIERLGLADADLGGVLSDVFSEISADRAAGQAVWAAVALAATLEPGGHAFTRADLDRALRDSAAVMSEHGSVEACARVGIDVDGLVAVRELCVAHAVYGEPWGVPTWVEPGPRTSAWISGSAAGFLGGHLAALRLSRRRQAGQMR